jgi:1-deoxy-D-xylulose-5-phosphate reductoisomerase
MIMDDDRKGLAILGSTGSVGTQTLDVVRTFPDMFDVVALACNRNLELLGRQIEEFRPRYIHCNGAEDEKSRLLTDGVTERNLTELACQDEVDVVVTATTGDVAIAPTLAAISARKQIALANKETIVMAGEMVTSLANSEGVDLMPLDSEPNAIWQCIRGERATVSRLIITASGGAFRDTPLEQLSSVTPQQALRHPTWEMGRKITVDSATLMNKAFEVIEAHWLFGMPWEDIEVVIHPQSVIHSMVEFVDGSVKAQLSKPDMRLPIQYALLYPERMENSRIERFDPVATGSLTFQDWERERYPCFDMAIGFAMRGGTWAAALSGANDAAVEAFLGGRIGFLEIEQVIRAALDGHHSVEDPDLTDIIGAGRFGYDAVTGLARG